MIRYFSAADVHAALDFTALADALAAAFAAGADVPVRHVHRYGADDRLLLMPAFTRGDDPSVGVKLVTFQPGNARRGAPTVHAIYVLFDRVSGAPSALVDGESLTLRRTAAMSALAARYLAAPDASRLLVIGTGSLAPFMARAHVALRPGLKQVLLWGRSAEPAARLANRLCAEGLACEVAVDLPSAVAGAHIVSCATTAITPVVLGRWLSPGTHLDLVGGFTPAMREVDDEAVSRAQIYVDTYAGALAEAGDLTDPLERGVIVRGQIVAELAELVRAEKPGRMRADQITLYKSVGTALADLAAARLVTSAVPSR